MTAMLPQEEKLAQKKIEAKFKKSVETTNSGGIGDKESTITGDMRRMARDNISNIDGELKDAGIKGIYAVPMGYAEYDYSELRENIQRRKEEGRTRVNMTMTKMTVKTENPFFGRGFHNVPAV